MRLSEINGVVKGFPNSKVDSVVFHGGKQKFSEFDLNYLGTNTMARSARLGIFFTDNINLAKTFGENIFKAYLSIQNPFELGFRSFKDRKSWQAKDPFDVLHSAIMKISGKELWDDVTVDDVNNWKKLVLDSGYDSLILYNTSMDSHGGATARSIENPYSHFYIVFSPSQIKRAD